MRLRPERYWPVSERGTRLDLCRRALGDDASAVHARAGAEVDDVVRLPDRVLVVLDDDDRVAEVAQAMQRVEQRAGCRAGAGRSTARRGRTCTPTRPEPIWLREADALRLAAGERLGAAVERQVVEADVDEETEAVA